MVLLHGKVLIYGLGERFDKYAMRLRKDFDIIGFSDKNNELQNKLLNNEKYVQLEDLEKQEFDWIILCANSRVSYSLWLRLKGKIAIDRIVNVEEIYRERISYNVYCDQMRQYTELNHRNGFTINSDKLFPVLDDISKSAGRIDEHYFLQDIYMAQKVVSEGIPQIHFDIGSRVDGFISHLLTLNVKVTMIDIRPLEHKIDNLEFICADATNMCGIEDNSIASLSSLHAIEHFGLGRYGDEIDPEAPFKAMKAFQRVVVSGGKIYVSVPCGNQDKVVFNAHRIFNPYTIINEFSDCVLQSFAYVKDYKIKEYSISEMEKSKIEENIGAYACGMFVFIKK